MTDAPVAARFSPSVPHRFAVAAAAMAERWARVAALGWAGVAKGPSQHGEPLAFRPRSPGSADRSRMHDVGLGVF